MAGIAGETGPGDAVLLLGVGDTHGDFAPLFEAVRREPFAQAVLQVGDLTAGKPGRDQRPDDDPASLATLPVPLVWIHGNHEHWHTLGDAARCELRVASSESGGGKEPGTRNLEPETAPARAPGRHLWPGQDFVVPGTAIQIVGLAGNYAPTWYDRDKPFPGDRMRHFNAADVAALDRFHRPAVLLMHEAFRGQAPGRIGLMGIPVLTRLVRRLQPAVCLTGHHHTLAVAEHGPTLAIALPRAQEGYVRLWFTPSGERQGWEFAGL
ncbi:MAG: metallophosphoesterase family protein [Chloroflexota bacterium]